MLPSQYEKKIARLKEKIVSLELQVQDLKEKINRLIKNINYLLSIERCSSNQSTNLFNLIR